MQTWKATPFLSLHCLLAEGPYYEPATQTLRFVDIKKKHIHAVPITSSGPADEASVKTLTFDIPVTVTADIAGVDPTEKIVVGAKYGAAVLDRKSGALSYIARWAEEGQEDNKRLRSNDAGVDPQGRFWVGTMTDFGFGDFQPEGSVFTIPTTPTAPARTVFRNGFTIPNTIGWSPDSKTMYITHSSAREIYAYDYCPTTGTVTTDSQRLFYTHPGSGEPDGFRVDVEGNLWHAVYGEGKVLKISPEGKVVGEVSVPTANVTCVEFVGTEIFMTTAADEDEVMGPSSRENGGGVFRCEVGATAVGRYKYKLV